MLLSVSAASTRKGTIVRSSTDERAEQKVKAPLVDSTLLRFLSSQKNGPLGAPDSNGQLQSAPIFNTITEEETVVEVEVPSVAPEPIVEAGIAETKPAAAQIDEQSQKIIESQSWLSQYNAQKVALKLQALGVDETTSLTTGKVVQDYVLARVTRRRIRKFLQERDASWEAGNPLPFDRSGMRENMSPSTTSNYNLDGVVSVMMDYGLTGMDIAAIFSHTPSVAMMKDRLDTNELNNEVIDSGRKGFTLAEVLDSAFVGLLGDTLKLRRYDARKVSQEPENYFYAHIY